MDEGTLIHHHFLAACLVTRLSLNLVTKHAVRQPIKINKLSATTQSGRWTISDNFYRPRLHLIQKKVIKSLIYSLTL